MTNLECATDQELRAFLLGELPERVADTIARHLDDCPTCLQRASDWDDATDSVVHALRRAMSRKNGETLVAGDTRPKNAATAETAPESRCPQGFTLLEEIGRGSAGVVYKARQQHPDRIVALKFFMAGAHAAEQRARFLAEANIVASLNHPHIVQIHSVGEHGGHPYLCLEYLGGDHLGTKIGGRPQPPREAARLVELLARAVQHAHDHGIIHRDLKPANVLLSDDDVPKVTDFGLARFGHAELTATGAVLGTPAYMSPEQARGENTAVGPASDVWALGAILYELLTGQSPFRGVEVLDTLKLVAEQEPVPPARLQPGVPRDLNVICLKCLEKRQEKRYATADALADDLKRFQDGLPIQARPVGLVEQGWRWCRRKPALAMTAGISILSLLTVTVVSIVFAAFAQNAAHRIAQEQKNTKKALDDLRDEHEETQKARRLAERRLGDHALETALSECALDANAGMLRLAHALEQIPDHAEDLAWTARMNLAAWSQVVPQQRWDWAHGTGALVASPAAFNKDGTRVVTTASNGTVRVWSTVNGQPISPLLGPGLSRAAISPDGATIVIGGKEARLRNAVSGQPVGPPLQHEKPVNFVAFDPNGSLVLTCCEDGSARLWDTTMGAPAGPFMRHNASISTATFSPDGRQIVIADANGSARVWSAATGQALTPLMSHPKGRIWAAAFSPDGKLLLTGGSDNAARFWNAETGQAIGEPLQHNGLVTAVAFSPDGTTALTANQADAINGMAPEGAAKLWSTAPDHRLLITVRNRSSVRAVAFSPDGQRFVTGGDDRTARIWETATGRPLAAPLRHRHYVRGVAFSPDGRDLLTTEIEGGGRLWRANSLPPVPHESRKGPPSEMVLNVVLSNDAKFLFSRGKGSTGTVWDVDSGKKISLPSELNGVRIAAFSPDNKAILIGYYNGSARLYSLLDGNPIGKDLPLKNWVTAAVFSPDGSVLMTGTWQPGMAQLWEAATGQPLSPPLQHKQEINAVAFSPNGKLMLVLPYEATAQVYWADSAKPAGSPLRHKDIVSTASFSPNGRWVATASWDTTARLWHADSGLAAGPPMNHPASLDGLAFSPDSKILLTTARDGMARLWDPISGQALGPPMQHDGPIRAMSFSPNGRMILTGGVQDKTVRLWETATGRPLGPPVWHRQGVTLVAFTPDGRRIVTTGFEELLGASLASWPTPQPLSGSSERIKIWTQVITGMELDGHLFPRQLDAATWEQRRRQLEDLGGPPQS